MALTTHEKIRVEAGFQERFLKQEFITGPTIGGSSGATTFHVKSDYPVKFVPEFGLGGTIAGVSDVEVWCGLSGINGVSRMTVSSINVDSGAVSLNKNPDVVGCSLTISYASSPVTSRDIEDMRLQAESIISQRLSLCYDLPISPTPAVLTSLASRLSAAFLLIKGYGVGSPDTSADGNALYEKLMGSGERQQEYGEMRSAVDVGEIGKICTPDYQLVDDGGVRINRNDDESIAGNFSYKSGGRVRGRLYIIDEEEFRYKEWPQDVNIDRPGSIDTSTPRRQG